MAQPEIKTKVVGSYPIPLWLSMNPSTPTLRDAIMVVLKTQELAGIDLISDGLFMLLHNYVHSIE